MNISIGPYFGTEEILNGSSTITRPITTNTAVTPGWPELRRLNGVAYPRSQSPNLNHLPGGNIATAYFRPQPLPELEFDPDRYYDPDVCSCVYEGHQNEFERYQMAMRQETDTAQYAAESGDQEVASLNALNGAMFPPLIFWVGGFAPGYFIGG